MISASAEELQRFVRQTQQYLTDTTGDSRPMASGEVSSDQQQQWGPGARRSEGPSRGNGGVERTRANSGVAPVSGVSYPDSDAVRRAVNAEFMPGDDDVMKPMDLSVHQEQRHQHREHLHTGETDATRGRQQHEDDGSRAGDNPRESTRMQSSDEVWKSGRFAHEKAMTVAAWDVNEAGELGPPDREHRIDGAPTAPTGMGAFHGGGGGAHLPLMGAPVDPYAAVAAAAAMYQLQGLGLAGLQFNGGNPLAASGVGGTGTIWPSHVNSTTNALHPAFGGHPGNAVGLGRFGMAPRSLAFPPANPFLVPAAPSAQSSSYHPGGDGTAAGTLAGPEIVRGEGIQQVELQPHHQHLLLQQLFGAAAAAGGGPASLYPNTPSPHTLLHGQHAATCFAQQLNATAAATGLLSLARAPAAGGFGQHSSVSSASVPAFRAELGPGAFKSSTLSVLDCQPPRMHTPSPLRPVPKRRSGSFTSQRGRSSSSSQLRRSFVLSPDSVSSGSPFQPVSSSSTTSTPNNLGLGSSSGIIAGQNHQDLHQAADSCDVQPSTAAAASNKMQLNSGSSPIVPVPLGGHIEGDCNGDLSPAAADPECQSQNPSRAENHDVREVDPEHHNLGVNNEVSNSRSEDPGVDPGGHQSCCAISPISLGTAATGHGAPGDLEESPSPLSGLGVLTEAADAVSAGFPPPPPPRTDMDAADLPPAPRSRLISVGSMNGLPLPDLPSVSSRPASSASAQGAKETSWHKHAADGEQQLSRSQPEAGPDGLGVLVRKDRCRETQGVACRLLAPVPIDGRPLNDGTGATETTASVGGSGGRKRSLSSPDAISPNVCSLSTLTQPPKLLVDGSIGSRPSLSVLTDNDLLRHGVSEAPGHSGNAKDTKTSDALTKDGETVSNTAVHDDDRLDISSAQSVTPAVRKGNEILLNHAQKKVVPEAEPENTDAMQYNGLDPEQSGEIYMIDLTQSDSEFECNMQGSIGGNRTKDVSKKKPTGAAHAQLCLDVEDEEEEDRPASPVLVRRITPTRQEELLSRRADLARSILPADRQDPPLPMVCLAASEREAVDQFCIQGVLDAKRMQATRDQDVVTVSSSSQVRIGISPAEAVKRAARDRPGSAAKNAATRNNPAKAAGQVGGRKGSKLATEPPATNGRTKMDVRRRQGYLTSRSSGVVCSGEKASTPSPSRKRRCVDGREKGSQESSTTPRSHIKVGRRNVSAKTTLVSGKGSQQRSGTATRLASQRILKSSSSTGNPSAASWNYWEYGGQLRDRRSVDAQGNPSVEKRFRAVLAHKGSSTRPAIANGKMGEKAKGQGAGGRMDGGGEPSSRRDKPFAAVTETVRGSEEEDGGSPVQADWRVPREIRGLFFD